ncbi:MAG TPA: hypothetical protein VE258_16000, partial [Ktedonobacterales bacterium]|nr:hypothetical protein [Ktedonobacterales bacterium]
MTIEMTCARCCELAPFHAAGALDPAARDAVERHLAACAACRRELALWDAVSTALAMQDEAAIPALPLGQSTALWSRVQSQLPRAGAVRQRSAGNGRHLHTDTQAPDDLIPIPAPRAVAHGRRRPLAGIAAVALIAALAVALFGVVAPKLGQRSTASVRPLLSATPAACAPSQLTADLPANASLSAISMASARDGWAAGKISDPSNSATPPQTLMLHLENCRWQQAGPTINQAELTGIAMTSPSDGWAIGTLDKPFDNGVSTTWEGDRTILLHYQGNAWVMAPSPNVSAFGGVLRMVSPAEGWMLLDGGKTHTTPYTAAYAYTLLHYTGSAWQEQSMPFKRTTMILTDIAAIAPDDLWIVGYDTAAPGGGIIAHYSGRQWSTWSGTIGGNATDALYAVAPVSPSSVWVFGTHPYHDAHGDNISFVAFHFDGSAWSLVPTLNPTPSGGPFAATALPAGDAYAFDQNAWVERTMVVQHCVATACQGLPLASVAQGVRAIRALALFSATQGFAIGDPL